jgi:hypothetical protein
MRASQRRPAPTLVVIAVGLFAVAITALVLAASGAHAPVSSARDRADSDPGVAHALVVDRAPGDHAG